VSKRLATGCGGLALGLGATYLGMTMGSSGGLLAGLALLVGSVLLLWLEWRRETGEG
jgi:hypothetical protein